MTPFKKTIASNGLRIITVPRSDALATTFLVLVEAGSKYETKDINGLSHFLEHMCFKGTAKRPRAITIAGELDGLGAEYNAFTSQEYTGYYAKVEAHKLDRALDVVSDIYLNPVFDADEIEKEKGVIIEELNMYEDTPMRKVQDVFMELLYGDQPAGWDVGGRKEVIRAMTRDHFLAYRSQHYLAGATVVIVAGAFDQSTMIDKIQREFAAMPTGVKTGKPVVVEQQDRPALKVKLKEVDQTHLVLGCRAFSLFDPRRYALNVLGDILGGGMSSRLFQRVREQLGAAYYVRAEDDLRTDHGLLAVSAGVEHSKLTVVIEAILDEMKKLAAAPVAASEFQKAKNHLIGRLILGLESSDALASFYGGQEVLGQPLITPEQLIASIEAVTPDEVRQTAADIFREEKLNLALIGPVREEASLAQVLRF